MSEIKTQPVKAIQVHDIDEVRNTPGAFEYYVIKETGDQPRGMIYSCPCGCDHIGALPFHPKSEDDIKYNRAAWRWNGNIEEPTLTPSVLYTGHWHGYLTAGVWLSC